MGDWNSNSPSLRGIEYQPNVSFVGAMQSARNGLLQRFRSPGAVTISHLHLYTDYIIGNPGIGLEILDTIAPTPTLQTFFPGTDAGASLGFWEDQANGAATFARVDDLDNVADFLRTSVTLSIGASPLPLMFRGTGTALTGKRISQIVIAALVRVVWPAFASSARMRGRLNLGGVDYTASTGGTIPANNQWQLHYVWALDRNPATGNPWTQAEVNAIVAAGATDEFGLAFDQFSGAAESLQVAGLACLVEHVPENRKGFLYQHTPPKDGWGEYALGSTSALAANTHYWAHVFAPHGGANGKFGVPILHTKDFIEATGPAVAVGEHRKVYTTVMRNSSYTVAEKSDGSDNATAQPGAMLPLLLDVAGTIQSQSQPYALVGYHTVDATFPANTGQEVTSAAGSTTYGGVFLKVTWANGTPPDRPFVVELRSAINGGTLHATATLEADDRDYSNEPDPVLTFIKFDVAFATAALATQYFLHLKSGATTGRGWKVAYGDTRSDRVLTGAGTTVAEVEQASFGAPNGQSDSMFISAAELDRFDYFIELVAAPAPPATLTVTAKAAA